MLISLLFYFFSLHGNVLSIYLAANLENSLKSEDKDGGTTKSEKDASNLAGGGC